MAKLTQESLGPKLVHAAERDPSELVDFEQLSLQDLPWEATTSGQGETGIRTQHFNVELPVQSAGQALLFDAQCTVERQADEDVRVKYRFTIHNPSSDFAQAELFIHRETGDRPIYAGTSVKRHEGSTRTLPPGIGRTFYWKILDLIAELSKRRKIFHNVTAFPDGITQEQWHDYFHDELIKRGYTQKGVRYTKTYGV